MYPVVEIANYRLQVYKKTDSVHKTVHIQKLHRRSRQHRNDVRNSRLAEKNILLSQQQSLAEEVKHDLPSTVNKGLWTPY